MEKNDMNEAVFGEYMAYSGEETLARIYLGDEKIPVNISLEEGSDPDLESGMICSAEIWSNEYEIGVYSSEEEYEEEETGMATVSMIPMGTFPADEKQENFTQNAFVLFTGIVREVEPNPAPKEDDPLWRLRIETYALTFDLFYYENEPVEIGSVVEGQVWLRGTLRGLKKHEQREG